LVAAEAEFIDGDGTVRREPLSRCCCRAQGRVEHALPFMLWSGTWPGRVAAAAGLLSARHRL